MAMKLGLAIAYKLPIHVLRKSYKLGDERDCPLLYGFPEYTFLGSQ